MFTKARLTLTIWYVTLLGFLCIILSGLYYQRTVGILQIEYNRINQHLRANTVQQPISLPPELRNRYQKLLSTDLNTAKTNLKIQLLIINSVTILAGSLAAYLLAGITLQPIENALNEQRRFVTDAAHELKTPLTAMQTSLEVNLLDTSLPASVKKVLNENLTDVSQLSLLVHRLLDLAKPTSQVEPLTKTPLLPLVTSAIRTLTPLAKKANIAIHIDTIENSVAVLAKANQLKEMISIFLDNAIKYSPPKTTVSVSLTKNRNYHILSITDQGYGIDKEDLPHIFDRFYRADPVRTHSSTSGHGLGLSLANKYAAEQGIILTISSKKNHGTTISMRLRRA